MNATAAPTIGKRTATKSADIQHLFERWQQDGDEAAREQLVARFLPLARSLARRYGRSSEPFEDLLQVASLGLLKAIDRYQADRGHPFQSFAVPTILGEMRRYFRDSGWAIHVPRGAQERALKVLDALQAIRAYETVSLDAPRGGGDDDVVPYGDTLGREDERYELVELDAS